MAAAMTDLIYMGSGIRQHCSYRSRQIGPCIKFFFEPGLFAMWTDGRRERKHEIEKRRKERETAMMQTIDRVE